MDKFGLTKKQLLILLSMIFLVILIESMQSFVLTKDINLSELKIPRQEYIMANIIDYFLRVVIYIFLSVYTYETYKKIKIDLMYKGIWTLLIISNILYKLFVFPLGRELIFYYLSIIMQIMIVIYILTIKNQRKG